MQAIFLELFGLSTELALSFIEACVQAANSERQLLKSFCLRVLKYSSVLRKLRISFFCFLIGHGFQELFFTSPMSPLVQPSDTNKRISLKFIWLYFLLVSIFFHFNFFGAYLKAWSIIADRAWCQASSTRLRRRQTATLAAPLETAFVSFLFPLSQPLSFPLPIFGTKHHDLLAAVFHKFLFLYRLSFPRQSILETFSSFLTTFGETFCAWIDQRKDERKRAGYGFLRTNFAQILFLTTWEPRLEAPS